jgi:hypothetical protein
VANKVLGIDNLPDGPSCGKEILPNKYKEPPSFNILENFFISSKLYSCIDPILSHENPVTP